MTIRAHVVTSRLVNAGKGKAAWTAWECPSMSPKLYTAYCCDCGLAHQYEFQVAMVRGKPVVRWRVRRANLYTQMHRARSKDITKMNKGERLRALCDGVMVAVLPNGLRRTADKKRKRA